MLVKLLLVTLTISTFLVFTSNNNLIQLLIATEYVNFLIFPLLIALAVKMNNPNYLIMVVVTTVFAAVETGLLGFLLNKQNA